MGGGVLRVVGRLHELAGLRCELEGEGMRGAGVQGGTRGGVRSTERIAGKKWGVWGADLVAEWVADAAMKQTLDCIFSYKSCPV